MLRIRFSRTGKVGQPSYRITVSEHRMPVKGRYLEVLGHYLPARKPKIISIEKDRILYWISKGAIPSDSVASLLQKQGVPNMEKYLAPRTSKKPKKGEITEEKPATPAAPAADGAKPA